MAAGSGCRRVPPISRPPLPAPTLGGVAGCETPVEFARALREPAKNRKLIRRTLSDSSRDRWTLPALADALRAADEATFAQLRDAAGPTLSQKRVRRTCGRAAHWDRFFGEQKEPLGRSEPEPKRPARQRNTTSPASPRPATAAGKAVPLRDAGSLMATALEARAAEKDAALQKEAESEARYLKGTVQCRECLRSFTRGQLPNPRRRVCEDCGGRPETTSVLTVSGGSPGLGRRR